MTDGALQPAIDRLTDVCDRLGQSRPSQPSRYTQLSETITGARAGGHTGACGSRPPLALDALQLLQEVDREVAAIHPAPNGWQGWTLQRLQAIKSRKWRPQDAGLVNRYTSMIEGLSTRIDEMFDPPTMIPVGRPCPTCGTSIVYRDSDGERLRHPALVITSEHCACHSCGAKWMPEQYKFLGELLK